MEEAPSTKDAVYQALISALSADYKTRSTAETQLRSLEVTEDYSVNLVSILASDEEPDDIRQFSVILLRKFIESHWDISLKNFRPPEVPESSKQYIRESLCEALGNPCTKIRSNIAYTLAFLVHNDFPDEWPEVMNWILATIRSGDEYKINGALRTIKGCLVDFKLSLSVDCIPHFLSSLLEIIDNSDSKYSLRTRSRAVELSVVLICELNSLINIEDPKMDTSLNEWIKPYVDVVIKLLQIPDGSSVDMILRSDMYKLLALMTSLFIKFIEPHLPNLLPLVWEGLVKAIDIYLEKNEETADEYDEDGGVQSVDTLVISAFELVTSICESDKLFVLIHNVLPDLLYHIIRSMQVTEITLTLWNRDINKYIEDDCDYTFEYNVKIVARNVLRTIMDAAESSVTVPPFCQAICRLINTSQALREANSSTWWKGLESSMFALGSVTYHITKQYKKKEIGIFDLSNYLLTAASYTQSNEVPLLVSRCIWICGCYSTIMNEDSLTIAINNTVHLLQTSDNVCIRISAVKAVMQYLDNTINKKIVSNIRTHLQGILNGLCSLIDSTVVPIQSLILQALIWLVKADEQFIISSAEKIIPISLTFFIGHSNSRFDHSNIMHLLKRISQNRPLLPILQEKFSPVILNIMNTPPQDEKISTHATALEALGILVRYHNNSINDNFIKITFNTAIQISIKSTDPEVLQVSIECMRNFLMGAYTEICSFKDTDGRTGIDYILKLVFRVLDPDVGEDSLKYLGRLMILLLTRAGEHLSQHIEPLLRAFLSKIHTTKSISLVITFSYLIYTQIEGVMAFLTNIPGPKGEPALSFVLNEWIYMHTDMVSGYEYRMSIIALVRLLQYGLLNEHHILRSITIPERRPVDYDAASTSSHRWVDIPVLVKIFKLLLRDLEAGSTSSTSVNVSSLSRGTDESKLNIELSDVSMTSFQTIPMDDIMPETFGVQLLDHCEEIYISEDIDPIANIDAKECIVSFLLSLRNNPILLNFQKYLTPQEMSILFNKLGIEIPLLNEEFWD